MDWFLYDNGLRHERVKDNFLNRKIIHGDPFVYYWEQSSEYSTLPAIISSKLTIETLERGVKYVRI